MAAKMKKAPKTPKVTKFQKPPLPSSHPMLTRLRVAKIRTAVEDLIASVHDNEMKHRPTGCAHAKSSMASAADIGSFSKVNSRSSSMANHAGSPPVFDFHIASPPISPSSVPTKARVYANANASIAPAANIESFSDVSSRSSSMANHAGSPPVFNFHITSPPISPSSVPTKAEELRLTLSEFCPGCTCPDPSREQAIQHLFTTVDQDDKASLYRNQLSRLQALARGLLDIVTQDIRDGADGPQVYWEALEWLRGCDQEVEDCAEEAALLADRLSRAREEWERKFAGAFGGGSE